MQAMSTDNEPWTVCVIGALGAWVYVTARLDLERVPKLALTKGVNAVGMDEFNRSALTARWENGSPVVFRDADSVTVTSLAARRLEVRVAGETLAEVRARVEVGLAPQPPKRARRGAKATP